MSDELDPERQNVSHTVKRSDDQKEPKRPVISDDYLRVSSSTLMTKKAELQEKVALNLKLTNEYKKKVGRLASLLNEAKEPGLFLSKEITDNRDKIQQRMQENQRFKDGVFKTLMLEIDEEKDKVKSVYDQADEAKRQIEEAHKFINLMHQYQEEQTMALYQKILRNLADIFHRFIEYIREFFKVKFTVF